MKYYVLFTDPGCVLEGPWTEKSDLLKFVANVWFNRPARTPYAMRGRRITPAGKNWLLLSVRENGALSARPLTAGDLSAGDVHGKHKDTDQ